MKFGGRFEITRYMTDNPRLPNGEYRFGSIKALLTNTPNRLRAQLPGSDSLRHYRQSIGAWFVQDTWKVMPRVTLDLGLRHEWATVPTERDGKISNLDTIASPEIRVGDPLFKNPSLKNFSPRVGLALDAGRGTVVRAGYGLFPDLILSHFLLLAGVRNPPFFFSGTTSDLEQGALPGNGYEAFAQNAEADIRAERIEPNPSQPYVQQWNFNIEQSFGRNTSVTLAYLGSHGLNLSLITEDANLVTPVVEADGRLFFPADGDKINPNFGQIKNRTFEGHSFYHSFNAQLRQRLWHGVQGQISYTFGKSIDDGSNYFASSESANYMSLPLNGNPRFNRGLSSHDVRHSFVVSGMWNLPSPRQRFWKPVFGGWRLGLIGSYASGQPITPRLGYDAAQTKTVWPDHRSGQRPDRAPGAGNAATGDPNGWIDASVFARPADGYLGNVGRNTIIGPDFANMDFSVIKSLRLDQLGERARWISVSSFSICSTARISMRRHSSGPSCSPRPASPATWAASPVPEPPGRSSSD